jgi:hypothetical protein
MMSLDAAVMPIAIRATNGAILLMRPSALVLHVKLHHARPRAIIDSCLRVLAMGLVLLVVIVML